MMFQKLLKTLQTIPENKIKKLEKFVASPYFYESNHFAPQKAMSLFHYLMKYYPDFEHRLLHKRRAHSAVFNEPRFKDFSESRLDVLATDLMDIIHQFIAQDYTSDGTKQMIHLIGLSRYARKHQLHTLYENNLQNLQDFQSQATAFDKAYYLRQLLIDLEQHKYMINKNSKGDIKLEKMIISLNMLYSLTQLENIASHSSQLNIININAFSDYSEALHKVIQHIPPEEVLKAPVLKIFFNIAPFINVQQSQSETDYLQNINLLQQFEKELSIDVLKIFYTILRNYCTARYIRGEVSYLPLLFDLQKDNLEKGFLLHDGNILKNTLLNIVTVGLRAQKRDEVVAILEKRILIADVEDQEAHYDLMSAKVAFFDKKHLTTTWDFVPAKRYDMQYELEARRLELKIMYEIWQRNTQHASDNLDIKLQNFYRWMRGYNTSLMSENIRQSNELFIKILKKIIILYKSNLQRMSQEVLSRKKLEIGEEIKNNNPAEREWLLDLML